MKRVSIENLKATVSNVAKWFERFQMFSSAYKLFTDETGQVNATVAANQTANVSLFLTYCD